jgi:hypothetical protein
MLGIYKQFILLGQQSEPKAKKFIEPITIRKLDPASFSFDVVCLAAAQVAFQLFFLFKTSNFTQIFLDEWATSPKLNSCRGKFALASQI